MTSVVDFAHAAVTALVVLAAPGSITPAVIDGPALIAATAAHQAPDPAGERWLDQVRRVGAEAGLAREASRIFITSSGRAYAPVLEERAAILARAHDPALRAAISYRVALADGIEIRRRLGRPASFADLVIARRLGIDTGLRLIEEGERRPHTPVSSIAPDLASGAQPGAGSSRAPTIAIASRQMVTEALPLVARSGPASLAPAARKPGAQPGPGAPAVAGWVTRVDRAARPPAVTRQ